MSCRNPELQQACFSPDDISLDPVSILFVTVYDENGAPTASYYQDQDGNAVDADVFLGGGIASIGKCEDLAPECVESQEWTYGIDNTGTTFSDTATYELTLSDGSVLQWDQTPTSGWSAQLTQWATNIQTAADTAGLIWFVEPRAVNNIFPSVIDGTYGTTPTGLPGAPTVAIAEQLIDGGMGARYVNFQVCPGQPVPVSARRLESTTYTNNPYDLTAAGPILGVVQKFYICRKCGKEPLWYLDDNVTLAEAGQIPNCVFPCGNLSLQPDPPNKDCQFQFDTACDNNNETDPLLFTNLITRRVTYCSGQQVAVEYYSEDPLDPSALEPYTLVGEYVDCASGEPVVLPDPVCNDFVVTDMFVRTPGEGLPTNREWDDYFPAFPISSDIELVTSRGAAIRENFDFSITPDFNPGSGTWSAPNDTSNTASVGDVQVIEGFLEVTEPRFIRYNTSSEGYIAFELGQCCGPLELTFELGKGVGNISTDSIFLPAGIHRFRVWNIDTGGSNSNWNLQTSEDDITFVNDTNPSGMEGTGTKPTYECIKVKVCKDSGAFVDLLTDEVYDVSDLTPCASDCTPATSSGGSGETGEVFDGNVTDISPNPDQTHVIVHGTGSVPAGLKSVTINNLTGITTIDGAFELGTGRRLDAITYNATEIDRARGLLPTIVLAGGTWQWTGIQPIAEV